MRLNLKKLLIISSTVLFVFSLQKENHMQLSGRKLVSSQQAKIPYQVRNLPEKTSENRNIQLVSFPAQNPKRASQRVLIQAAMHGNETLTISFVVWLMNRYAMGESLLNKLPVGNLAFDFIPILNPDGHANASRNNKREVNLNRNFSFYWGMTRENPGIGAFSEKETQALKNLFAKRKYDFAIDVHGYANWIVMPSPPRPNTKQKEQIRYQNFREKLRLAQKTLPGYEVKTPLQLGDGGAFEDWAFWEAGVHAFCLEMVSSQRFQKITRPGKSGYMDTFLNYEKFIYEYLKASVHQTIIVDR